MLAKLEVVCMVLLGVALVGALALLAWMMVAYSGSISAVQSIVE